MQPKSLTINQERKGRDWNGLWIKSKFSTFQNSFECANQTLILSTPFFYLCFCFVFLLFLRWIHAKHLMHVTSCACIINPSNLSLIFITQKINTDRMWIQFIVSISLLSSIVDRSLYCDFLTKSVCKLLFLCFGPFIFFLTPPLFIRIFETMAYDETWK